MQELLYVPEADAGASQCTLCRACLAAAVQISDLVFHKCRMTQVHSQGISCKERGVS